MMNDPMMGAPMPMGDPMGNPMGAPMPPPPEQDSSSMALAAAEVTLEMLPMLPDTALQALAGAASQELQGRMGGNGAPMPMADPMMAPPPADDPMMQGIGAMAV